MKHLRAALVLAASTFLVVCSSGGAGSSPASAPLPAPVFDDAFWKFWGDGYAELAGYDLTTPRYRAPRQGSAVTIFVTESFSNKDRVKADGPEPGAFPVMKLNLVKDFPTGVYDYNLMASSFVALTAVNGRGAGQPTKISFGSQEWCGHVYHQALFDAGRVRHTLHSYFQGEADQQGDLAGSTQTSSEDALALWARGFAAPAVPPGGTARLPLLTSLERARLRHQPVALEEAELSRSAGTETVTVPAGSFAVRAARARVQGANGERTWTYWVEEAAPHRLIAWESSDGERAELLGSERLQYWQLNAPGGEQYLEKFGLTPRARRMP